MNDVTRILSAIEHGEPEAAEHLLPLVYDELRKLAALRLAHEKPGQTLQATDHHRELGRGQEALSGRGQQERDRPESRDPQGVRAGSPGR